MEPLSIVMISAAAGGFAGKFIEKTWDSGEKWLMSFFKNHKEPVQKQATENSLDFLSELAQRVKMLEQSNQISKEKIENAQNHPDFSALLQKALISSSQTENKDKHIILARLVSERLKSEPETILSLSSKMACDAISYSTVNQLMILGLAVNLYNIRPNPFPPVGVNENNFQEYLNNWLSIRLKPYEKIQCKEIDMLHLEALSCLKINTFIGRSLNEIFGKEKYKFNFELLKEVNVREAIKSNWNDKLEKIDITTVGQIIGVSVSDLLTNTTTNFVGWE